MELKKICKYCGEEFERNKKYSYKQWDNRKYCSSSCGAKARIALLVQDPKWIEHLTKIATGRKQSLETKIKRKIFRTGTDNPLWKGGISVNNGYLRVNNEKDRQYLHRGVVERFIGRKLTLDEVIHHIDGNKKNNDISNLKILSQKEHGKLHGRPKKNKIIIGELLSPDRTDEISKKWQKVISE